MIGRLKGILLEKNPPNMLIDVQGVGYDVLAPMSSFYPLPGIGAEATLHTHFAVSETAQQLYGFVTKGERELFRLLIRVNGVGPKMALALMSGMNADEFVRCVQDSNVSALVKVPGVGRKTAERLIVEMRDKLGDWSASSTPVALAAGNVQPELGQSQNALVADAESALIALGYKPTDAAKAVAKVLDKQKVESSEELIRLTLRGMMPA